MSTADIIITALVLAAAVSAVYGIIRMRRRGNRCAGCPKDCRFRR